MEQEERERAGGEREEVMEQEEREEVMEQEERERR